MKPLKVLHLTAHLGGGVGKALSGLAKACDDELGHVQRTVVCAETPEKSMFLDAIRASGCEVLVNPTKGAFRDKLADADIVQLEWWNHPETIRLLVEQCSDIPHRLLVWAHVSGLGSSMIPANLMAYADRFCFTSPCSLEQKNNPPYCTDSEKFRVISSGGGFDGFDVFKRKPSDRLRVGYVGTLNFSKLHPDFVHYLSRVDVPDFQVRMIGDEVNRGLLEDQCKSLGHPGILQFAGFTPKVAEELACMDILVYLLNPTHYGTAENALLEAMAMGVVPIVLANPAEKHIVSHLYNGLVVDSPEEFAEGVHRLYSDQSLLDELSKNAQQSVRDNFCPQRSAKQFSLIYLQVMQQEKHVIEYRDVFGQSPAEWFLSCQPLKDVFQTETWHRIADERFARYALIEQTKGSVHHFARAFPESLELKDWSSKIRAFEYAN